MAKAPLILEIDASPVKRRLDQIVREYTKLSWMRFRLGLLIGFTSGWTLFLVLHEWVF
jgi:hypothetical protein